MASMFFYGWWNPTYLVLIIVSIIFNYSVGSYIKKKPSSVVFIFGIAGNLCLIVYFKYLNFVVENINIFLGTHILIEQIALPLAISFFTFQQIAYLIEMYRGETRQYDFLRYCLFVTFFPQLIAGPIVRHEEMLSQYTNDAIFKFKIKNIAVGTTIFTLGLFKKVVLADGIAVHATPVFNATEQGIALTFFEAWGGALAYAFQLYFDFSGYSDMAIGLARLFGVVLPVNFYSPFKEKNIADFWRHWHITLSNFIRDHLFFPIRLKLTRYAMLRKHSSLVVYFITMVFPMIITWFCMGLWHGAGWNFIIFGLMHGSYFIIFDLWKRIRSILRINTISTTTIGNVVSRIITFTAVLLSFVMFRAENIDCAMNIYAGMAGINAYSFPIQLQSVVSQLNAIFPSANIVAENLGSFGSNWGLVKLFILSIIVWLLPNTLEWMWQEKPARGLEVFNSKPLHSKSWCRWEFSRANGFVVAVFAYLALIYMFVGVETEFLYFNF
jgi:alginate O-acetyltransferase complex protein AlgI